MKRMIIDRNNYETFFIDYLDGNLPLGKIDLLLDFLKENPDLADELKDLEKIKIHPSPLPDSDFQHLKRSDWDLPEIFEDTCIRVIENELSGDELQSFHDYLRHNARQQKTFEQFWSTISEPDPFIVYNQKDHLKKKEKSFVIKYWVSIAAVLLLALILFLPSGHKPTMQPVARIIKSDETKILTPINVTSEIKKFTREKSVKKYTLIAKSEKVQVINTDSARIKVFLESLNPIFPEIQINQVSYEDIKLAQVERKRLRPEKDFSKYLTIKEFIVQKLFKPEDKSSIEKVALNALRKVSGDKFNYATSKKGEIKKIEFTSPFFAFSIPMNTSKN